MIVLMRPALIVILLAACVNQARADALERLQPERLAAARADVATYKSQRADLQSSSPFHDYRANLHVHSAFSHDSRGKIEDIVAAAKTVGTQVLMFTEHPADHYDFFKDGHQGTKDGVLLIPGAEMQGFLVFPTASLRGLDKGSPQEFTDLVRGRGGLMFLSHLEERMDWQVQGLTGCEIYNTHADFKDEKMLAAALRNPLWLIAAAEQFHKYPQEAFSALQDAPVDYLRKWDALCERAPHTGISANDAHQNLGLIIRLTENGVARIESALGERLLEIDPAGNPDLLPLIKNKKPGDIVFELRLDRYEHSLRHVSTHLLMNELSRQSVWEALETGRAYVAFDWIADPRGFDFAITVTGTRHEMGSRMPFAEGLNLAAQSPLDVTWKVIRSGKLISESSGATLKLALTERGHYRVEAWLRVAGKMLPWILSNPIYVR